MTHFRLLRAFNDEKLRGYAGVRARLGRNSLPHFAGDSMAERVMRELAHERALPTKEAVEAFERAVDEITAATTRLLRALVTTAPPKNREVEAAKARERAKKRYSPASRAMQ